MRWRFVLLPALLILLLPTAGSTAPFKPKMNEPEAYHDIRFGIDETKSNVDSATCGGWDPGSGVDIKYDPSIVPPCNVAIDCQAGLNSCGPPGNQTTGTTGLKGDDGVINICMSMADAGGHGIEYLMIHELTHAKQQCALPANTPSPAGCCSIETEAYTAQCQAEADDGLFNTPQAIAAGLNLQTCIQFGVNEVSCPGQGCYPGDMSGLRAAYLAAATTNFNGTCDQLKANPPPRVQSVLDNIQDISNSMSHMYVLTCKDGSQDCVPLPEISPDLPGRDNQEPLGKAETGIGIRGDYVFPDSTQGYMSACNIYQTKYTDEDLKDRGIAYGLEDDDEDRDPNTGKPLSDPGDVEINQEQLCIRYANATPHQCQKLYNRFRTLSDNAPRPVMSCHTTANKGDLDGDGNDDIFHYAYNWVKTYCFDYNDQGTRPPVNVQELAVDIATGAESQVTVPFEPPENTKQCYGQECRTPFLPVFMDKFPENCDYDPSTGVPYHDQVKIAILSSFYRHYSGPLLYNLGVNIREVKHGDDIRDWKVRGECYEYYDIDPSGAPNGEDWKPLVSTLFDEKCELIIGTKDCGDEGDCSDQDPHQQQPLKPRWKHGEYLPGNENSQKESYMPEVDLSEPQRGGRTAPDAWKYDDNSALALLDNRRVQKVQRLFEDPSDPSGFLDALLESKVRGGKTVPDNVRTDGFDDSAEREVTKWWEKQQKALLKLIQDPTVKLIMPARMLVGLSDDDPLFKISAGIIQQPDGTVEMTLKAGPDELGNVVKSFRQMYVAPIREVRMPILTLLVSKSELESRKAEWKLWKVRNPDIAGDADPLIDKIDEYLGVLEHVRQMRLALAGRLQKMYQVQKDIRDFYGQWYVQNSQILLSAAQASLERQKLKTIWRKTQKAWLQADACQILWCSNQRFSAPVYTLLDNWWKQYTEPDGDPVNTRDRDALPDPPDLTGLVTDTPDMSYDFSYVGLSRDEWQVPVLWPVSVRIKVPLPPTYKGSEPLDASKYPSLPSYPDETAFDGLPVPTAAFPAQTIIDPIPVPDLEAAKQKMRVIRRMIEGISVQDQINEEQNEEAGASSAESDTDTFPMFRDSMRGALCRLDPSVLTPPSTEQQIADDKDYGNPIKIIHTETDLMERAARIWSRWMPQRKEDYGGRVIRVATDFPDPVNNPPPCKEDVVCVHLPSEVFKSWKWQWFLPDMSGDMRAIADQMRDLTLPQDEDHNPFLDTTVDSLKRLFPKVEVPVDIILTPPDPPTP